MSGMFMGINTALSSLQAQQSALNTLSNNIANANTPGYKRQRVVLNEGNPLSGLIAGDMARTALGTGVHVEEIQRVQNDFVDTRVRQSSASASEWTSRSDTLSQLESILNEPSDNGIAKQLDDFWSAWDKLSAQPDDLSTRTSLIEQAQTLTARIRDSYNQAGQMASDIDSAFKDKVTQINSLTSQISQLNAKIAWSSSSSVSPNDLLDQRDQLVGQLSDLAGVDVSGKGGQDFTITLGNKLLVQGVNSDQLGVRYDANGFQEMYSLSTGESRTAPGGEIAGLIASRNQVIPGFMTSLNNFVNTLATQVNWIHGNGYNLNGTLGGNFFQTGTTAADFVVSPNIVGSPANIAASSTGDVGNNETSNGIANLRNVTLASGQSIDQTYQAVVSDIGTQSALAKHYADSQKVTLQQFTAQQESISGVSLDEEMTDMVKFQQAYNAAARVLTTCDDMLSTLIEKTGVVGR